MKRRYRKNLNNKGSALVTVMIAMAFIGILSTLLMFSSMMNFQMKHNNLRAKDNFYSAETAIDEITLGLQKDISSAVSNSYQEILTGFETNNAMDKQYRMRFTYLTQLQNRLSTGTASSLACSNDYFDVEILFRYLVTTRDGTVLNAKYTDKTNPSITHNYSIQKVASGTPGAQDLVYKDGTGAVTETISVLKKVDNAVITDASMLKGSMTLYETGLVLEDITITYTDDNFYTSVITTDLRINVPNIDFAQAVTLPALTNYSLIAANQVRVFPKKDSERNCIINGGVYAGTDLTIGSLAMNTGNIGDTSLDDIRTGLPSKVNLKLDESLKATPNNDKRIIVGRNIVLGEGSSLKTDEYGEVWTGAINMYGGMGASSGSEIEFAGNSVYVLDDTIISGSYNKFSAGTQKASDNLGKYIGFGSGDTSDKSSAIVINGNNTELDLSKLTDLTLAGNAYVGLSDIKNSGMGLGGSDKEHDVLMGQSIAVKSDQIAYLIPPECLFVDEEGVPVVSGITNPMTVSDYQNCNTKVSQAGKKIYTVSNNVKCTSLGGKSLSDYGINTTSVGGKAANYQTYFKQINSKISLVYFYVSFDKKDEDSVKNANQYFKDYYNANTATLNAYTKLYTSGIMVKDNTDVSYTLHVGGNIVSYGAGNNFNMINSTAAIDKNNTGFAGMLSNSSDKYQALCKKLIDDYMQLEASDKISTANAYSNLVRSELIASYYADLSSNGMSESDGKYFVVSEADPLAGTNAIKAVIAKGDYTYTGTGNDEFDGLIIAAGDVTVKNDFSGTILSGRNIIIDKDGAPGTNIEITNNETAVLTVLKNEKTIGTRAYSVTDFLVGGSGYVSGYHSTYADNTVNIGDLVVYENWDKQ